MLSAWSFRVWRWDFWLGPNFVGGRPIGRVCLGASLRLFTLQRAALFVALHAGDQRHDRCQRGSLDGFNADVDRPALHDLPQGASSSHHVDRSGSDLCGNSHRRGSQGATESLHRIPGRELHDLGCVDDLGTATVISRPLMEKIGPLQLAFISSALTTPLHLMIAGRGIPESMDQFMNPTILLSVIYSGHFRQAWLMPLGTLAFKSLEVPMHRSTKTWSRWWLFWEDGSFWPSHLCWRSFSVAA